MADQPVKTQPTFNPGGARAYGGFSEPTYANFGDGDNQYKVDGFTYPFDLLSSPVYGGNYAVFYLNVHEDSKVLGMPGRETVDAKFVAPRLNGNIGQSSIPTATSVALGSIAVGIAAKGAGITNRIAGAVGAKSKVSDRAAAIADTALGVAAGGYVSAIASQKKTKRMKTAIALHMPVDLQFKYGVTYAEADLAGTSAIASTLGASNQNIGEMRQKAGSSQGPGSGANGAESSGRIAALTGNIAKAVTGAVGNAADQLGNYGTGLALQTPGIGQYLAKSSGLQANPKREQLFKNVDFRTFSFSYQFYPRDPAEAASIFNIIKEFKLHMHPEYKDTNEFLFVVPSEFDIYYYHNGEENLKVPRHTSCVLTDMSVMYTPQGVFSTFADGTPTQINVTLTFRELAIVTKETIMDGY